MAIQLLVHRLNDLDRFIFQYEFVHQIYAQKRGLFKKTIEEYKVKSYSINWGGLIFS